MNNKIKSKYPHTLLGPKLISDDNKNEIKITRIFFSIFTPDWTLRSKKVNKFFKYRYYFYFTRSIVFLNEQDEVAGQANVWIPLTRKGLKMVWKCRLLLSAKPFGVTLEQVFSMDEKLFKVTENSLKDMNLSPYVIGKTKMHHVKRTISLNREEDVIAIVEEKLSPEFYEQVTKEKEHYCFC